MLDKDRATWGNSDVPCADIECRISLKCIFIGIPVRKMECVILVYAPSEAYGCYER